MMGSWGLDSWVRECLVLLGAPGSRPPGWKDCTFSSRHVRIRVRRPGPAPSPIPKDPAGPHLGRALAPTGQALSLIHI